MVCSGQPHTWVNTVSGSIRVGTGLRAKSSNGGRPITPSRSASVRIASQKAAFSACIAGRLYIGGLACGIRSSLVVTPRLVGRGVAWRDFVYRKSSRPKRPRHRAYIRPASTRIRSPVIDAEAADARNNAASATSSGSTQRRNAALSV
jgi:hypothetical protein